MGSLKSLMGLPSMVKRIVKINAMHTVLSNKAATSYHQPIERGCCVAEGNGLPGGDAGHFRGCVVDMESGLLIVEGDSALDGIGEKNIGKLTEAGKSKYFESGTRQFEPYTRSSSHDTTRRYCGDVSLLSSIAVPPPSLSPRNMTWRPKTTLMVSQWHISAPFSCKTPDAVRVPSGCTRMR